MIKNKLSLLTVGFSSELSGTDIERYFAVYNNIPFSAAASECSAAKCDACLINCDHNLIQALDIAEILCARGDCAVAFSSSEPDDNVIECCSNEAVPVFQSDQLDLALMTLYTMHLRLSSINRQAVMLKTTLDDVRLINRAKLLLIERYKMSEKEAHRYIEKTAMDSSQKKRDVAISIIRTYES